MKDRGDRRDGGCIGGDSPGATGPHGRVANDNDLVVTMTRGELNVVVQAAVRVALDQAPPRPLLVDKPTLALQLCCSQAHIDALRKHGLPTVMVGQSVRFETLPVLAWLRERSSQNDNHGA